MHKEWILQTLASIALDHYPAYSHWLNDDFTVLLFMQESSAYIEAVNLSFGLWLGAY
jgi:hypothetical protein